MGQKLGALFHALYNEVIWLHAGWFEYRKLFGKDEKRVDFLNSVAPFFFHIVQDTIWDDVILNSARLTGPKQSNGKDNLTLLRLPDALPGTLAKEVQSIVSTAAPKWKFAHDHRNRRLAHRDLALSMGSPSSASLPEMSREAVEGALTPMRDILNRVHEHYLCGKIGFEYFDARGDAEALVYHLAVARQFEEGRRMRIAAGTTLPNDFTLPPSF